MTKFEISIVSDTVCPWCYVGYRRLQSGIAEHLSRHPADSFNIAWRPFQLDPKSPRGQSVEKIASYEKKFGPEQAEVVFSRLRSAGKDTGIEFNFAGRTGNTLDSHRLIELAGSQNESNGQRPSLQTRLVEELFGDYFERARDITSHTVLAEAAGRAGLDRAEAEKFLEGNELVQEVAREASDNQEVNGVPNFTINDVFTIEGAQEPRAFTMLFERLKKREKPGL